MSAEMTDRLIGFLLIFTNAAIVAEMMFDSHTLRKIALMRAKRRLNRMVSRDTRTDKTPEDAP